MIRRGFSHLRRLGMRSFIRHSGAATKREIAHRVESFRAKRRFLRTTSSLRRKRPRLDTTSTPQLIVSLTSFPARITTVWATIETLMRQTLLPDAVVLTLSVEEFPTRRLPRSIRSLERRGLIVLWHPADIGSYNKLIPARGAFPGATIVTVDDDVLYAPDMLRKLVDESAKRPGWIIGHRGWDPVRDEFGYRPYLEWMSAGRAGPRSDPDDVFLTGVGGVLYPSGALNTDLLLDVDLARRLAPTADDVWFWAVALASGAKRFCTGMSYGSSNGLGNLSPSLFSRNKQANDEQIAAIVQHLNL